MPGHDPHGSAKRRRTLETLAMKNRSGRAPFGEVDGNTLAGRARQPSSRQGKKSERALSPAEVRARDAFEPAPASPMDAEMDAWDGEEEDDAPFGSPVSESFHEWLTRAGLRGPLDPDRGGTLVSARQREELQRVWGDAAETETLRRLVENLKDGELEMARLTQAAHERAAARFEEATETAWRGRLEAASDAELRAKEELHAREAAVDAAEAEAREERRAARDAASATDALRSRLEAATRASANASRKCSSLENELREAKAEVLNAGRALAHAKHERDSLAQNLRLELASQLEGFEAERDAYHKTRNDAAAREKKRHDELVERLRSEARDLRAAAASAETRLREQARDGADGKTALKQALALREAEAEVGRRTDGEAQRRLRLAEENVARLEAKTVELCTAAETKISTLERALASAKASASAAETAEAVAEEGAAKMKRAAAEAVAGAEAKAREAQRLAENAVRRAKDEAEAATASARAARDAQRAALESLPANNALRAALERVTNAHASAVARAEAAERRGDALREELAATKRAAAAAAKQVASAVADARGQTASRVEAKEAELRRVEAQVAEAEKRLRSLRRDAEEAATAPKPVAQKTPGADCHADPLQTRYASITPRTRSRASLRASHGAAKPQSPASETRSPGTELRRRAIAMGMRASPFAPKRKR